MPVGQMRNGGIERLSNVPKVTRLINGMRGLQFRCAGSRVHILNHLVLPDGLASPKFINDRKREGEAAIRSTQLCISFTSSSHSRMSHLPGVSHGQLEANQSNSKPFFFLPPCPEFGRA